MKSIFASLLHLVLLAVTALAQNTPTPPGLTFLYSLNCTLGAAYSVGSGPHGNRVVIPITGGTFKGPRLSGKILNLGADWGLIDKDGLFSADTRYHLQTDDGAHIFIRTSGPTQPDGRIHLRILFETGSQKYYWLNNIVAVGVLKTGFGGVSIDAWQLS
ncbi:hypothetical protein VTJ83DRAFT_2892 [Remersonia thermophila]|uniref:Uncharacterized protein n=1 Tax=Remersonia thermophila TaxID=72144 RepID=A0ABR4DCH0_9PEZI